MGLDVWLTLRGSCSNSVPVPRIYIRDKGTIMEISREEWDIRSPGIEPAIVYQQPTDKVFSYHITHNLIKMAKEAYLYIPLWHPEEIGIVYARDLIEPLEAGLAKLKEGEEYLKQFNPANGWGDYEGLVIFTEKYLEACKKYPTSEVHADR